MSKELGKKLIQVVGVVIDVEFAGDVNLPAIFDALTVKRGNEMVTLEVAQHLNEYIPYELSQ